MNAGAVTDRANAKLAEVLAMLFPMSQAHLKNVAHAAAPANAASAKEPDGAIDL